MSIAANGASISASAPLSASSSAASAASAAAPSTPSAPLQSRGFFAAGTASRFFANVAVAGFANAVGAGIGQELGNLAAGKPLEAGLGSAVLLGRLFGAAVAAVAGGLMFTAAGVKSAV